VADTLVNAGERAAATGNKNGNVTANLFYGHRFGKTGRLFSITNEFSAHQANTLGRSASATRFSDGAEEAIRQRNEQATDDLNFTIRLAYTEPIGEKQYLQANYSLTNRSSTSDLAVYDIVNETSLFNPEQSNQFSSGFLFQRGGLTYQLTGDKYNLAISSQVQQSTLSRRIKSAGSPVRRSFQNLLPEVHFKVRLTKTTRLNFDYNTSVREPTVSQLQPVVSRYDPLNLLIGNPNLRPEYSHQGKVNLSTFKPLSGLFLSGGVTFNYTTNPITAAVTIDERQVRTTQYVNVGQSSNAGATFTLGIPIKKFNSWFNLGPYFNQGRSLNLLDGIAGAISQRSVGGNLSYAFTYEDYVDLNLHANLTATSSAYALNKNQNQLFVNSAYTADATVHFLHSFNLTTEFTYSRFQNVKTNFDQAIPILNLSLSRSLLKDERGALTLSAINVLNRTIGATQLATVNYIEQTSRNALGNYYMLSFSYRLKKTTI
jgi:outer membrane receptor protein involved in Fe transport